MTGDVDGLMILVVFSNPSDTRILKVQIFPRAMYFTNFLSVLGAPFHLGCLGSMPACKDTSLKGWASDCTGNGMSGLWVPSSGHRPTGQAAVWGGQWPDSSSSLGRGQAGELAGTRLSTRVVTEVLPQACKSMFPDALEGAGCCADAH